MLTLGIVPDPKGREAHFQDFAYVLVLKGVGPSEELQVQKEKKYSLGTFSSRRRLHTIPYQSIPYHIFHTIPYARTVDRNVAWNLETTCIVISHFFHQALVLLFYVEEISL